MCSFLYYIDFLEDLLTEYILHLNLSKLGCPLKALRLLFVGANTGKSTKSMFTKSFDISEHFSF